MHTPSACAAGSGGVNHGEANRRAGGVTSALSALSRPGQERGQLRRVKGEQVFDTLSVGGVTGGAIRAVHGAVEGGVRGAQGGGLLLEVVDKVTRKEEKPL
jgi:hypothetical protein